MFKVTTTAYRFHKDKGKDNQIVNLKYDKCSCNKWQSFAHVAHMCLLFVLMQGLIVDNMLTDTLLWMHMQDVMLHNFFLFHINHIGQSQISLFFIQIQHFYERNGDLDHQG